MRVLVIGSGLLGLTTAWSLRRHGADVAVIEREAGPGRATSFANGAMLHASQANPWNEPGVLGMALRMLGKEDSALLVRLRELPYLLGWGYQFVRHSSPARYLRNFEKNAQLAAYSLDCMRSVRGSLDGSYHYAGSGTLKIFRTREAVAASARLCAQLSDWGIRFEAVDGARAAALEPALAPIEDKISGGLYFPDDESGDAHRFCELLAADCRKRGVVIDYGVRVKRLLRSGNELAGVVCGKQMYEADAYVLAAGPWSSELAATIGVKLPIQPVKGYSITVPTRRWPGRPTLPVIDDALHAAACPLGDQLRVAGTAEFTGFDLRPTPSRIDNLFRLVEQLYPAFAPHLDREAAVRWCGLRPMSADGVGIMGPSPVANLYLNTGHGPLGWTMAAGAGQLVADQIMHAKPALDPTPYHLARFG